MNGLKGFLDKRRRAPAVEMFRVALMFMIVLDHCYEHGIFSAQTGLLHFLFRSLLMFHVTGFVAISGWFGIRPTLRKFFALWGLMAFYSVLSVVFHFLAPAKFLPVHYLVQGGWFGGAYLMLMCLAPILNAGIDALFAQGRRPLLCAWGMFAGAVFLTWAPAHCMLGVNGLGFVGPTAAMMVFVYVTARVVRLTGMPVDRPPVVIAVAVAHLVLTAVCERVWLSGSDVDWIANRMLSYSTPWVVALPVVLLPVLEKANLPRKLGNAVCSISPLMFGVYLLHDATSFGRVFICDLESWLTFFELSPFVIIPVAAICVFAVACLVETIRQAGWSFLSKGMGRPASTARDEGTSPAQRES